MAPDRIFDATQTIATIHFGRLEHQDELRWLRLTRAVSTCMESPLFFGCRIFEGEPDPLRRKML
jgi:hypothetical protein